MKIKKCFLLLTFIFNLFMYLPSFAIHGFMGEDNRKESSELTDTLKLRSHSIVTVVRRHENNHVAGGGYKFNIENSNPLDLKICEDQRFAGQNRPAEVVCGGTLISSDLILTAQNCIQEGSDCTSDYSFIFGYTEGQSEFNPRDVYHCQEVIWQKNQNGVQAAIVRLDRPVNARIPIPLDIENSITENQDVVLIGPHAKLPLKSSSGQIKYIATEPNLSLSAIGTNLDCHTDDLGSAILNPEGQLIGVLNAATELAPALQPAPPIELSTTLPASDLITSEAILETKKEITAEPATQVALEAEPNINKQNIEAQEPEKTSISADLTKTDINSVVPVDVATTSPVVPDPLLNESTTPQLEPTKTCLIWSSPKDVTDRSLYQPITDPKKISLAFIPRGCTFTPVSIFIDEVSKYLPQYQKTVRTPTASQ